MSDIDCEKELKNTQALVISQQYHIESLESSLKSKNIVRVIICPVCRTSIHHQCWDHKESNGSRRYAKHSMSIDNVIEKYAFWSRELMNNRNPFKREYFSIPITNEFDEMPVIEDRADDKNGDSIIGNVCGLLGIICSLENFNVESEISDYIKIVKVNILTVEKSFVDISDNL